MIAKHIHTIFISKFIFNISIHLHWKKKIIMPFSKVFPRDDKGTYITLDILKEFKDGDMVNIFFIKTDLMEKMVPSEIVQDGPRANLQDFPEKMYFKNSSKVTVHYYLNSWLIPPMGMMLHSVIRS